MKIKGLERVTRGVEIDVDPNEAFWEIVKIIYVGVGLPCNTDLSIKDGKIWTEEEIVTSHSSYYKRVVVETPTEDQLRVIKSVDYLRTMLYKSLHTSRKKKP